MSIKKKLLSFVTAGVVAAVALVGSPLAAFAGGSDDPTPYVVNEQGITLPDGDTFPDSGHVNLKTSQGDRGIHFESLNWPDDHPKKYYIGKSFIPWSAFGLSGDFCVTWVQVGHYNEHYGEGGQAPVCVTDKQPLPKDAVASVAEAASATCEANSTVTFTIKNATWTTAEDLTVGTHSRTAAAAEGHLFADGSATLTVHYTISAKLDSQSSDPNAPCYTAPPIPEEPELPTPVVTYTEWTDGEWTCGDTTVTQTRIVTTTPWKNVLVEGVWEAVLDTEAATSTTETTSRDLTEEELATCEPEVVAPIKDAVISVSAATAATCTADSTVTFTIENATWIDEGVQQEDGSYIRTAIANEGHAFADGSTTQFVQYRIEGKLDSQSSDPKAPCYVAPEVPEEPELPTPVVTYTEWTDGEWTCGDTTVTQTRIVTTTPWKNVLAEGEWETIPDTEAVTSITETGSRDLTAEELATCEPEVVTPILDAIASVSTGSPATCAADSTVTFTIKNATWADEGILQEDGSYVRTAVADQGHAFADSSTAQTVQYRIEGKLDSQSSDPEAPCYVAPTEPTTPEEPTVVKPTPTKPTPTVTKTETPKAGELAKTGSDQPMNLMVIGILLTLTGAGWIAAARLRRKQTR